MMTRGFQFLAPLVSLLLAGGLFVQMKTHGAQADTEPYHARLREEAARIPLRLDNWTGVDMPLPPAAGKLLRPNVMFSRHYRNELTRISTNLILVQCLDARDMSGHYPPNCYRGNGWAMEENSRELTFTIWGRTIPVQEYNFTRSDGARTHQATIYNFFVLPTAGVVTSMEQVREASGDYRARPYGAAQVQVMMDAELPEEQRLEILREMLEPLGPVVELLEVQSSGGGE